ncbi:hypothetical protein AVEN_10519-1 [Araneus ventricosus]|uniref:Uncharacterized protein n=1 Tax=Araneus ventricosus TaxID=182803 RepID=A0A4Y2PX17_ARAVE|nr:hypothetical protein AVEN_10519-1 [Araneus ventricosus]
MTLKFKNNISFGEARKIVNDTTPKSGISYSTVVKSQFTNVSVNATQTDEFLTKVVCPPLKKLQQSENTVALTKQISLPKSASHTVLSAPAQTATSISIPSGSVTASSDISLPTKSIPTNKPKNKKDTNTLKQEQPKVSKKARAAALKIIKESPSYITNLPASKEFLKISKQKQDYSDDPFLSVHPSDEDLMTTESETNSPPSP